MTLLELLKTIFLPEYDNQYFEKAQAVIDKISIACSNFLKKLEEFPIEGVYEASASKALSKIYYPPCMCLSYEQNIEVVKILGCNDNPSQEDIENIELIIFDVYTDDKIRELLTSWKEIMRPQRWDIVNEAIETYFNGHYYACNALLLSQYDGIIVDNENAFNDFQLDRIVQRLDILINMQNEKKKKTDSEKNILERHLMINLQATLCVFAEYFKKYVFSSGDVDANIINNVANRNKVLHGEDCGFGSKSKALKTIIGIDLLIKLPKIQSELILDKNDE